MCDGACHTDGCHKLTIACCFSDQLRLVSHFSNARVSLSVSVTVAMVLTHTPNFSFGGETPVSRPDTHTAGFPGHAHSDHLALTLVHILLALWAWLANSTQIINLLLDRKLRDQPRTVLMVSIGVAELVVAGVLCPLYTDSLLRGPWRHGPVTCSVYEAIFYLQVCVSSLTVLVFNVERLYFLLAPSMLTGRGKGRVTVLLTSLPWAVGILLVLPLYLHGAHATTVSGGPHSTCVVHWQPHLHVLTIFISFFAPGFLVLVTLVVVLLLYVTSVMRTHSLLAPETLQERLQRRQDWISGRRRRQRHPSDTSHLESDMKNRQECVLSVLLASLVSVGLQFPFFTMLLLKLFCTDDASPSFSQSRPAPDPALSDSMGATTSSSAGRCQFSDAVWAAVMMAGMAKPGLMPLLWLVYADVRAAFNLSACACACVLTRAHNLLSQRVDNGHAGSRVDSRRTFGSSASDNFRVMASTHT